MLRTGLYPVPANPRKLHQVWDVLRVYRSTAEELAAVHWTRLLQTGKLSRNATTSVRSELSARYVQTCQYQVVGQLKGYLGNLARAFKRAVLHSSLPEETKVQLLYLSKYRAWCAPEVRMQGNALPKETLRLARNVLRGVRKRHRFPDFSRIDLALDAKVAQVESSKRAGHHSRWIRLSTLTAGKPVLLPLAENSWFDARQGVEQNFCRLKFDEQGRLFAGLIKDIAPSPYEPCMDTLGLDVGLKHLLATSEGDLLGNQVLKHLLKLDAQVSQLAANRQRQGLRVRSPRYDRLVRRMRAFLENEVHRTLRQALQRHKPARVVVESLDFRSPKLSRRMNRLVQNFGRSTFTHCLESLAEEWGFEVKEVQAAYTSQGCRRCGYVDKRNREGEVFRCLHCRHREQADVQASRHLVQRARCECGRSEIATTGRTHRLILQEMVQRFATARQLTRLQRCLRQHPELLKKRRRHSSPCTVMLGNPYFAKVIEPVLAQAREAPGSPTSGRAEGSVP